MTAVEIGLFGAGAIGSRVAALLPPDYGVTIVDNQVVLPENIGPSVYRPEDCFQPKAVVAATRRRECTAPSRGVSADVRYAVRPGFVRALSGVVVCLDNPTGVFDLADAIWDAAITGVPLFVLTCGNESTSGGYQVRVFEPGRDRLCPICLFGHREREADRLGHGASCAVASAPRASAAAAEAAAGAGIRLLTRWLQGDRSAAGTRTQCDAEGRGEYTLRMPPAPVRGCSIPHHVPTEDLIDLDGTIDTLAVGVLAEMAIEATGTDAEILLGRRTVPMLGMSCPRCGLVIPAPLRLLPAAVSARRCGCSAMLEPLATRSRVGARELLTSDVAALPLRAFGSAAGEEVLAVGTAGTARLRVGFDWSEVG